MNLISEIEDAWVRHPDLCEERVSEWINAINENREFIAKARSAFHEWEPLRAYINITNAKKKGAAVFSLRFKGQEVGTIKVSRDLNVELIVNKNQTKANLKYFEDYKNHFKDEQLKDKWDGAHAKKFRQFFKKNPTGQTRSPEHEVETHLIKEMSKSKKTTKFGGGFSGIQPVLFEKCPFQLSSPIAGSEGKLRVSKSGGNMDIVARRRADGGKIRISIWELKKPDVSGAVIDNALKQAIIYAGTLRMMLRSQSGADWYRFLGFTVTGSIPDNLEIEAVLAIALKDKGKLEKQLGKLIDDMPLSIGQDLIIPCVAFYDDSYNVCRDTFKEIGNNYTI